MVKVLARLGVTGKVSFVIMDYFPGDEAYAAMERALENVPKPVKITPEFCEEIRHHEDLEAEQTKRPRQ